MPAPDLTTQTPGEPLATMSPIAFAVTGAAGATPDAGETTTIQAQAPQYSAKHNGGGRWKVWCTPVEGDADWFSDFMAVGDGAKEKAEAEAQRLNDGGEPLVIDAERNADREALAAARPAAAGVVDPTTLKQAVMTPDGWLCPEPKVKE
ncbi:hypothetical protein FBY06_11553 [Pseudomonas sp. SJZ085]|uniref:hypothetical protein n=1 Tax=unclassified Pseudomonas TaxID=196821 RepID=UPI00119B4F80|nr:MULTISPECIES: hypothetical protein [unclassified Pseudomonas]TWC18128.1 hypothetical protein FBX99_11553 [Pseudomonas sp. SJZ074]TWC36100.1 hypothetical protein FBY06_11553 [Pseudomonas sp. SJZ085]